MSPLPDDLDLLAAEYALGTLEGADLDRARALEASAHDFRARVQHWRGHFLRLDDTAAPVAASEALWQRIAASAAAATPQLASRVQQTMRASRPHGFWHNLALWRGLAGAGALAAVMLAFALVSQLSRGPESPVHVAVLNTDDGRAAAVVNVYASGIAELVPLETIAVPQGRIIEVWTLQNREQGPISIGRIDQARRIRLDLKNLPRPEANHLFELTLEPTGGSPTGKPTGPILMKGLAARGI